MSSKIFLSIAAEHSIKSECDIIDVHVDDGGFNLIQIRISSHGYDGLS